MVKQQFKTVVVTLILSIICLKYFVGVKVENQAFEVGHRHVKYHANWTHKFSSLNNVNQLQDAYKLKDIQSLDLSLAMSTLNFSDVKQLLPVQFQPYKTLKINLANNPIGTEGADYVLSLIPNGIEELQIAFDSISADNGLGSVLTKRLNNLNSLKRLKLSLILAVKDEVIVDDYLRFGRLGSNLESYSLILMGNELTNKSLGHLQTHLSRVNLKSLDLNLYSNKLQHQGAAIVAKALKTQTNLQYLNVDLYFNNITEVGTKHICDSIQSIATDKLKQLHLNFDFNYINNQGGKSVGHLLGKLKSLQKLNIGVASKNFGYNGYKHVVNGIAQLTKLNELTLRAGINRVGGGGATITKNLLLKLVNLKSLNINFYENYVGDEGAIQMVTAIAQLQHLQTLDLNFGFNDIKGYGFVAVVELLAKKSYNSLYLGFSSNEIQDPEVVLVEEKLKELIENTKNKFQFQFMQTAVSKKSKQTIEKLFKSPLGNNKKLRLNINSIITPQQQQEYEKNHEKRMGQLKKLMEDDKKKTTQKVVETVVNDEQKAEEVLQLDKKAEQLPEVSKDNSQL